MDLGDRVLALAHQRGRGASSGADVELDIAQLFTVRDGKVTRIVTYKNQEDALEAAVLSE